LLNSITIIVADKHIYTKIFLWPELPKSEASYIVYLH